MKSSVFKEKSFRRRAEEGKRWCYDCANYYGSYFCGYTSSNCRIHGSLDIDQRERHPDITADTCSEYTPNGKEPWWVKYEK